MLFVVELETVFARSTAEVSTLTLSAEIPNVFLTAFTTVKGFYNDFKDNFN